MVRYPAGIEAGQTVTEMVQNIDCLKGNIVRWKSPCERPLWVATSTGRPRGMGLSCPSQDRVLLLGLADDRALSGEGGKNENVIYCNGVLR